MMDARRIDSGKTCTTKKNTVEGTIDDTLATRQRPALAFRLETTHKHQHTCEPRHVHPKPHPSNTRFFSFFLLLRSRRAFRSISLYIAVHPFHVSHID